MNLKGCTSLHLYAFALVSGTAGILMTEYYTQLTPIAVILVWPAFISGANAVRQIARYGLGTGTSSIGYWGTAVGAVMAFISPHNPFLGIFSALLVGAVTGIAAQKIIRMKIPVMIQDSAVLASSTAIISVFILNFFTENYSGTDVYIVYPLIYIATTIAVLHPFNGSMGAGENQKRTLHLSAVEASMTTGLFGLVAVLLSDALFQTGLSLMIVSTAGFILFFRRWFSLVQEDAYELTWSGYPEAEH